jgi:UDP-N-acetylmuramoyl-tripeptide--D-alanyl-D-alanine ligase
MLCLDLKKYMLKNILEKVLAFLTKRVIKKYNPKVIGITGSVGKSTTKRAITHILSSKFSVRSGLGNYNTEIGVPLAVFGKKHPGKSIFGWVCLFVSVCFILIKKDKNFPEILVIEMGADHPGDISYLTNLVHPNMSIVTAVSAAHTEFFGSLESVQAEKQKIVTCLKDNEIAILNTDDEKVAIMQKITNAKCLTYGIEKKADVQASDIRFEINKENGWPKGIAFKVSMDGNTVPIFLPGIIGEHLVYGVLAAIVVGKEFGMNLVEIGDAMKNMTLMAGRMRVIEGIKHTLLIDDTYNASPNATFRALEAFSNIYKGKDAKSYVVLGDMLELGSLTESSHKEIGEAIAEMKFDYFIGVGSAIQFALHAAVDAGMAKDCLFHFHNSVEAGRFLQDRIKQSDILLVKGSQGNRMEKITKELMADPSKASELLVRQSEYWLNR